MGEPLRVGVLEPDPTARAVPAGGDGGRQAAPAVPAELREQGVGRILRGARAACAGLS